MAAIPKHRVIRWNLPVYYDKLKIHEKRLVREAYYKEQNGKCYYCRGSLDKDPCDKILEKYLTRGAFPKNFFKYPVHLHHCHNTGLTIGATHAYCNAVLWQYHGE